MEENILIKSEHYNVKKISIIMAIIGLVLTAIVLSVITFSNYSHYSKKYDKADERENWSICNCSHWETLYDENGKLLKDENGDIINKCTFYEIHPTVVSYMECINAKMIKSVEILISFMPLVLFILLSILFYFWASRDQLIVTDKRVYGKAAFGKRVDLPFDSISAVGTSWLKGIDVGTSSGRISFKLIKNQDDIHSIMSNLLMKRQSIEKKSDIQPNTATSNADELKKYKELLDGGVITQEEFDAKKKQLLGL